MEQKTTVKTIQTAYSRLPLIRVRAERICVSPCASETIFSAFENRIHAVKHPGLLYDFGLPMRLLLIVLSSFFFLILNRWPVG